MTNSEYASNQKTSFQSVFKDKINYDLQNIESKPTSHIQSYFVPPPINRFIFNSNFLNKNLPFHERFNSFSSIKEKKEDELFRKSFLQFQNQNLYSSLLKFRIQNQSRDQSRFLSKISNGGNSYGKNIILQQNKLILDYVDQENEQEKEEPKNEILFQHKFEKKNKDNINTNNILLNNNIIIKDNNNLNYNEKCTIEKNMNLNLNTHNNNNLGAKFFTNHNYGYKCSCSKTQCNRKYCECYNSGNYCIDCNCKNCKNQPPINTYSNKRPSEVVSKMKKSKEICTCTKSGCNKNYCECFKSGNKCTSLCRCIACENTEDNTKLKNKNNFNYECCRANSIYIIKNKLIILNVENQFGEENNTFMNETFEKKGDKILSKKRKREENKNCEYNNTKVKKNKKLKNEDNILFNDSLFDENGKVILRHINMIHY
jgi:hypothetical protein